LVTITGGEPLCQAETPGLVRDLLEAGHRVVVETNGTLPIDTLQEAAHRIVDLKPPSSGETERILWSNLDLLAGGDEVKILIADRADFAWAENLLAADSRLRGTTVNLSPVHGVLTGTELARMILEAGLEVRLNCQLHKFLWPEEDRGR
jgi:7-carboxy-7-deazaguanine synthase